MKKQVNELSIERARALLGNKISEEKLKKLLDRIRAFCKVAYGLYIKGTKPEKPDAEIKSFRSTPPDEFTNAA